MDHFTDTARPNVMKRRGCCPAAPGMTMPVPLRVSLKTEISSMASGVNEMPTMRAISSMACMTATA